MIFPSALFGILIGLACRPVLAQDDKPGKSAETAVDPAAQALIKRASSLLGEAKAVSFSAEIWEDVPVEDGPTLQVSRTVDVKLRRPNRLLIQKSSTEPERAFYYNSKEITVHDLRSGCYGSIKTPPTIDAMIEVAAEKFGIELPIEDLLVSKPFGDGAAKAKAGVYLGLDRVLGVNCHHVAFQSEKVDWQAWIDAGALPVMRKAVITVKAREASDQAGAEPERRMTAILSQWDFNPHLPDLVFEFNPPADALRIEVVSAEDYAGVEKK